MLRPGYIVAGGARTGSHWLEQLVKFITDYRPTDLRDLGGTGWVAHTNDLADLSQVDEKVRKTCGLLIITRRDTFARAMSHFMARHTDEWFAYTDRPIDPFDIDPQAFRERQQGYEHWKQACDDRIRPLYAHVIDFEFEELLAEDSCIEDHVARRLGLVNTRGHKDWTVNRNPRDYRRLVRNWQDLGG